MQESPPAARKKWTRKPGYGKYYEKKRKQESKKILRRMRKLFSILQTFFKAKNRGRQDLDPASMVMCLVLRERYNLSYRDTVSYLELHTDITTIFKLKKIPSKSALNDSALRLDRDVIQKILGIQAIRHAVGTLRGFDRTLKEQISGMGRCKKRHHI